MILRSKRVRDVSWLVFPRGGVSANIGLFLLVGIVVSFVAWLVLDYNNLLPVRSEPIAELDGDGGIEAGEKSIIEQELERRRLEEQRLLAELREAKRLERLVENEVIFNRALVAKDWEKARTQVGLLEADGYSEEGVVEFLGNVSDGEARERVALAEVNAILESAREIGLDKYSPEVEGLINQGLVIYPGHEECEGLRDKMKSLPYSLRIPDDVATLAEAVVLLRAGDTAILGSGVHEISVVFDKSIKVVGQGQGVTFIECDTLKSSAFTFLGSGESYELSGMTISGVGLEDVAAERFALVTSGGDLRMKNVTVRRGSGHGVAVVSGKLMMEGCELVENSWDGLSVMGKGSVAELRGCDVSGNYDHGVDFWDGASGLVADSKVMRNMGSGVVAMGEGVDVKLEGVKADKNRQCGLFISSGASVRLERVSGSGNVLSGVVVQGEGTSVHISGVVSMKNGEAGLLLDPASIFKNFESMKSKGNGAGDVIKKAVLFSERPVAVVLDADREGDGGFYRGKEGGKMGKERSGQGFKKWEKKKGKGSIR